MEKKTSKTLTFTLLKIREKKRNIPDDSTMMNQWYRYRYPSNISLRENYINFPFSRAHQINDKNDERITNKCENFKRNQYEISNCRKTNECWMETARRRICGMQSLLLSFGMTEFSEKCPFEIFKWNNLNGWWTNSTM